jgi:L-asparaginase
VIFAGWKFSGGDAPKEMQAMRVSGRSGQAGQRATNIKPTRVYVIYTGGTIGMRQQGDGYAPSPGYLVDQLTYMPEFRSDLLPSFDVHEYESLLDSSNMLPSDWLTIARDIAIQHDNYDGFIVLHGTDTMAYTSSALAFLLPGLKKPVVVTGSQIPLCEVRNDARENLITSLMVASRPDLPEVCLSFGKRILRGCRAVKVSADRLNAFDSPNFPPIGAAKIAVEIRHDLVRKVPTEVELIAPIIRAPVVAALRLFPGISHQLIRSVLQPPLQGLVLEAYGVGNGPDRNEEILKAIREATDAGVVVVACSQCLQGRVSLGVYETGSALAHAGVIEGADMTPEAALTKLTVLLGRGLDPQQVRDLMQVNLVGELTPTGFA